MLQTDSETVARRSEMKRIEAFWKILMIVLNNFQNTLALQFATLDEISS